MILIAPFRDIQDKYKLNLTEEARDQITKASCNSSLSHTVFIRTQYDVLRRLRAYWVPRYLIHMERLRELRWVLQFIKPSTCMYKVQCIFLKSFYPCEMNAVNVRNRWEELNTLNNGDIRVKKNCFLSPLKQVYWYIVYNTSDFWSCILSILWLILQIRHFDQKCFKYKPRPFMQLSSHSLACMFAGL